MSDGTEEPMAIANSERLTQQAASTGTTVVATPNRKILLVEDNCVNQQMALLRLQQCGYQVDMVEHGLAVLLPDQTNQPISLLQSLERAAQYWQTITTMYEAMLL